MAKYVWLILIFIGCYTFAAQPNINKENENASPNTSGKIMEYRFWDVAANSKRSNYQEKLLELALEKSKSKYGNYRIIKLDKRFTQLRATREVSKGELVNLEASPYKRSALPVNGYSEVNLITTEASILKNLLGYRQLIVRKNNLGAFKNISEANLKLMTAGQAQDWSDVAIYKNNGYKVDNNANVNNLTAMLVAGRVDYVPLSVIEAEDFIKAFPRYSNEVIIVPRLLLYYPFPVHFNVSANQPELAERLNYGLELLKKEGTFDQFFNDYFLQDLHFIQNPNNTVFQLTNPNLSDSDK